MAHGKYSETAQIRALRDLVEFAEQQPRPTSRPLNVHMMDPYQFPLWWMVMGRGEVGEKTAARLAKMTKEAFWALRDEVKKLLRAVVQAPEGEWPAEARVQVEVSPRPRRPPRNHPYFPRTKPPVKGAVERVASFRLEGEPRDVLLYQVLTLLDWLGPEIDRLRCCPAPDCRKLFVKVGRQEFCSPRCQHRLYASTYNPFAPGRPRQARRPPATSAPPARTNSARRPRAAAAPVRPSSSGRRR
jgi:hypothetical protein